MAFAGTTWLVSGGELPWSPEDIREHLNLLDPSFDSLIKSVIASQCIKHGAGFRGQVWAVSRGDDLGAFFATVQRLGNVVNIGPAYTGKYDKTTPFHDVEIAPDPEKARKAFRSIINWCWDDEGIYRAMRSEDRGIYRAPGRGADLSPETLQAAE